MLGGEHEGSREGKHSGRKGNCRELDAEDEWGVLRESVDGAAREGQVAGAVCRENVEGVCVCEAEWAAEQIANLCATAGPDDFLRGESGLLVRVRLCCGDFACANRGCRKGMPHVGGARGTRRQHCETEECDAEERRTSQSAHGNSLRLDERCYRLPVSNNVPDEEKTRGPRNILVTLLWASLRRAKEMCWTRSGVDRAPRWWTCPCGMRCRGWGCRTARSREER